MEILIWIVVSGLIMSAIALVGAVTLFLTEASLRRILLPLVAFAAGSLLGGAFFHMLPESIDHCGNTISVYVWFAGGFLMFFVLEQFLHWHHSHQPAEQEKQPLTYLILIADAVHNLIGGLSVGAAFVVDLRLGCVTWLAAAAHEIPQELGDFAVLVHGGWTRLSALAYNFLSALTFPLGGVIAYAVSGDINVAFLIPLAAGNFVYIAAADLIPEVKHSSVFRTNVIHLLSFLAGLALLLGIRFLFHFHGAS